jgi:hypothetical protein
MTKDVKLSLLGVVLAFPLLPFVYFGVPTLVGLLAYSVASGMQTFLSLPAWVLAVTAAALFAGTASCALGRLKGIHYAPLAFVGLLLMSGLLQANRAMFELDPGTQQGNPLDHVASDLASCLVLSLPWIVTLVVIGLSAVKTYEYAILLKARRVSPQSTPVDDAKHHSW